MPADADDYARRQQISSLQQKHGAAQQCPAGCVSAQQQQQQPVAADRQQQHHHHQDGGGCGRRYASEKNLLETVASAAERDHFGSDRSCADHFGSERGSSDRLPSGERYQGVSERFPLGERPQTSVSTDRLFSSKDLLQGAAHCQNDRATYHPERYNFERTNCPRFPDRYTPVLDRYGGHSTLDRYSRTATPTERYHTLSSTDKERNHSNDRYTSLEKYQSGALEMDSLQNAACYAPNDRYKSPKQDVHKTKERSSSSDRKERERLQREHYQGRYEFGDRFPTIPCPERFATAQERPGRPEKVPFAQVSYLEPPSPAPASDRFIPPPPLSPENAPSPDCFPNNTFPSPTAAAPVQERFIPPPPLSPSPTDTYSPSPKKPERYDKIHKYHHNDHRYNTSKEYRYHQNYHAAEKYLNNEGRFGDRYVPPNAHVPVERYVPQPQEPYYNSYQSYGFKQFSSTDPYMRRDLAFHYRLPLPYTTSNQFQRMRYQQMGTPSRVKCCQYQDGYQLSKSSPGSSSSSSMTSQGKDFHQCGGGGLQEPPQCQGFQGKEYHCGGYQQEKGTQCGSLQCQQGKECLGFISPNLRVAKGGQCRHSICVSPSVEYVGASGGRHVCATPPPRGSIGSADGSVCNESCCSRRSQGSITVTVWRGTSQTPQPSQQQQQQQVLNAQQPEQAAQPPNPAQQQSVPQRAATPISPVEIEDGQQQLHAETSERVIESPAKSVQAVSAQQQQQQPQQQQQLVAPSPVPRTPINHQRTVSLPAGPAPERPRHRIGHTQSERIPRPQLNRSVSRKEFIKNYIKKETANFFGVDEENENEQQLRWLDRRKRMACRTMGPLKEEYRQSTLSRFSHRRAASELPSAQHVLGQLQTERPDVLPSGAAGTSDLPDSGQREEFSRDVGLRRKDSVARMTWDGLSYVVATLTRHRPRPRSQHSQWSRSFPPETPTVPSQAEEQAFFDKPSAPTSPKTSEGIDTTDRRGGDVPAEPAYRDRGREASYPRPGSRGWRIDHDDVILRHNRPPGAVRGGGRIVSSMLDRVLDNSNRRQYGMGWVGRVFGRSFRKSVTQDDKIREQLNDMEDHRPMFTYWVTTVQILVLFISILCYGFGPFGIDFQSRSGQVLVTSLSLQQVDYMEPANFWFGPRAADLIHLGAKFAPCMRVDNKIKKEIDKIQAKERETACCIRNDDSGCVQSSQADCSKTISTWKKWTMGESGPGGRISGSVCGLDPKFCDAPASVHPYEWPDDITKWPICRKTNTQFSIQKSGPRDKLAEHMVCEVIGHPCCIGIHGQCKITTKEYCDFVRGTFHEEASLCSQVSCLNDVCGMIPFYFPDVPDQFYRLWTSIFLHAGILQLFITVLIQYFLMRDLEKLTGSLRIGIIYIGSGVAGNLASAIFVPYRADVGPAGCQFGLLACLIVEVLNAWPMLKHPNQALCKLLSITLVLFLVGLLPWVDNYAHLFGFVFGFLLSYALLPFISFGRYDRHKKIFLIWVCLAAAWILFICLVLLFYIIPVYDCKICSYFNCLPLTRDFCASQNINFKREEPIV